MLFDTPVFFAFLFLFLVGYHQLRTAGQNLLIVVGSYVFYGWWDWRFCGLLLLSTLVHYFAGLALARSRRRSILVAAVVFQLGLLGVFKYTGFFLSSLGVVLERVGLGGLLPSLSILLPVGISFYTFQVLAYTVDIWRQKLEPERNVVNFAAFVCFWPHLVAGPILRPSVMLPQISAQRRVTREDVFEGLYYVVVGLTKKVAVADLLSPVIGEVAANPGAFSGTQLLLTAILFSIRIYCDFSGYTDIARGVSLFMGFRLPDNFRWPYLAVGVREFWHRWHMSLSTWLRDYLYIPLGGSRFGKWLTYRNMMITMVLGGLWHGASWSFVLWGALHGLYLVIAHALIGPWEAVDRFLGRLCLRPVANCVLAVGTFGLVTLTWIPFFVPDISQVWVYLSGLVSLSHQHDPERLRLLIYSAGVLAMLDLPEWMKGRHHWLVGKSGWLTPIHHGFCLLLLILMWSDNSEPFIYFQF